MKNIKKLSLLLFVIFITTSCATNSWNKRASCAAAGAAVGAGAGAIIDGGEGALAGAAIGGLWGFIMCESYAAKAPDPAPAPAPEPPGDADGDGVTDDKDRCPGTPAGVKVDPDGCEIKAKAISLTGILFHTDSAELKSESVAVLNATADTLKANPGVAVEIAGHTDSTGEASYNQGLSERRAKSVREYLISKGVSGSRLSSAGYGESQPVATNSTSEGRQQNRRVELRVTQ